MTEPTNHSIAIHTHFGNDVTAPVIYVKNLGHNRALVHIETKLFIEEGRDLSAVYLTGSKKADGKYHVSAKVFTAEQTYIYMGVFTRK